MQLSRKQRSTLQANPILVQIANPYPRNISPPLSTGPTLAHQFRYRVSRDGTLPLSRDATSMGLAEGVSPRVDFGTLVSHVLVVAPERRRRVPAGAGDAGWKPRRTGEQQEAQSPTDNPVRPNEATLVLPTTPQGTCRIHPIRCPKRTAQGGVGIQHYGWRW